MLAAQVRPQLFLFFCITVCSDVTMQKPAQLLVTVQIVLRDFGKHLCFSSLKLLKWMCSTGTECCTDAVLQPAWISG